MSATELDAFDTSPDRSAVVVTVVAAVVATITSATTLPSTAAGLVGLVLLPIGVRRGSRLLHRLGAAGLFAAVLLTGAAGSPPTTMLLAAGASIVAWDAGEHGIGIGRQLGANASVRRPQLVHTAATVLVGTAVAAVGYVVFEFAKTGQPTTAVVLLLFAAILFTFLLDR